MHYCSWILSRKGFHGTKSFWQETLDRRERVVLNITIMLGRQAVIYALQEPKHVMWPLLNVTGTCRLYLYKLADTDIVSNKFLKPHSFPVCHNFSLLWRKRKIYANFEIKLEETTSPIITIKVFDLLFAHRIAGEKQWKSYFSIGTTGEKKIPFQWNLMVKGLRGEPLVLE